MEVSPPEFLETNQNRGLRKAHRWRVLLYSPDAGSRPGHSFTYAANICRHLAEQGLSVLLVTSSGFTARHSKVYGGPPSYGVVEDLTWDFSRTLPRSGVCGSLVYGGYRLAYSVKALRYLSRVVRDVQFDFMHWLDNPELITTLGFALRESSQLRRRGVRWYVNIHPGDLSARGHGRQVSRAIYKAASGAILRWLLRHDFISAVFVHGTQIKERLTYGWTKSERDRVIVAEYGIDAPPVVSLSKAAARQELGIPQDRFVALSFGMIRRDKRLDKIIAAAAMVEDLYLVIAGMPVDVSKEDIQQMVETAGLQKRAKLVLRYLEETEIPLYFSASDVAVFAHDRGFPGQSGPLHLACTYRIPVIASDVGDIGRFVRDIGVGLLWDGGDPSHLANALRRMMRSAPSVYSAYQENAARASDALSWASMVRRYVDAYAKSTPVTAVSEGS